MQLVSEGVDELEAGRLQQWHLVNVWLLQLGDDELVQVSMQLRLVDCKLDDAESGALQTNRDRKK